MDTDTKYNGWTNWETWHTALVADNDEQLYKQASALGARCAAIKAGTVKGKVYDQAKASNAFKRALAPAWKQTKQHAADNWPTDKLESVNWDEVAEHYMDAAEPFPTADDLASFYACHPAD
jgi:hypothetical protein